jgi:hypothetical protein
MRLTELANNEVGRLLNGTHNSQHAAIGHLATAATRAAESLVYLADIDDPALMELGPTTVTRTMLSTMATFDGLRLGL